MLRASGVDFDPDAFLSESDLEADPVYRRGEPRPPNDSNGGKGQKWLASGFQVVVSEAAFGDLPGQIRDALRFLAENEDELRRLGGFEGVEAVCLDFGVERRDVAVQSDLFDAELLWRAGALDIDLVVSHYALS